ncbi:MAG: hypothetical protein GY928_39615, partial [Colwellia sp.]|nr:hypothetical protein [Colwellia sp.]
RTPVNGSANAMLIGGTDLPKVNATEEELRYLINRLERKRKLLNSALGITTKAQRKNLMYKMNKGVRNYRNEIQPRIVDEYRRNGYAIHRLAQELSTRKKAT